ncbi:MAG: hypothetical protein QNJ45_21585 [Ardenticatenaceae bacterium]|nr:hypothetical protein [Ardenticatenaceae bacterium]
MEDLDRDQLQKDILAMYTREHQELGDDGTIRRLDWGLDMSRRWQLNQILADGGVLVFPHAGVADCGHQIAACVHAALDSGTDKVVVISVLHAFTAEMEAARRAVAAGGDPADWPFWGIQGPGLNDRVEWQGDHALMSWRHFWHAEVARRGLTNPPQMIERYPYLAGGKPEKLPGIEALAKEVEDAVIVSTADPFHHGLGYGDTPENAFYPDWEGLHKAKAAVEEGIHLLEDGDYWGYNQHCVTAKSDHRDAGQVFRYLRGPLKGEILDITYSDASELYKTPPPTWVATPLTAFRQK